MNNAECQLLLEKAQSSLQAARLLVDNNLADIAVTRAYYTMWCCRCMGYGWVHYKVGAIALRFLFSLPVARLLETSIM